MSDLQAQVADDSWSKFCRLVNISAELSERAIKYLIEKLAEEGEKHAQAVYDANNPHEQLSQQMYAARLESHKCLLELKEKDLITPEEANKIDSTISDLTKYSNLEDGIGNLSGLQFLNDDMKIFARNDGSLAKETLMKEVDIMPQLTDALGNISRKEYLKNDQSLEGVMERAKREVKAKEIIKQKEMQIYGIKADIAKSVTERLR